MQRKILFTKRLKYELRNKEITFLSEESVLGSVTKRTVNWFDTKNGWKMLKGRFSV